MWNIKAGKKRRLPMEPTEAHLLSSSHDPPISVSCYGTAEVREENQPRSLVNLLNRLSSSSSSPSSRSSTANHKAGGIRKKRQRNPTRLESWVNIVLCILAVASCMVKPALGSWSFMQNDLKITCNPIYKGTSYSSITEAQKETITCYSSSWQFKQYPTSTCTPGTVTSDNITCVASRTYSEGRCAATTGLYTPYTTDSLNTSLMWCPISQIYDKSSADPDSLSSRNAWLYCNCTADSYVPPLASLSEEALSNVTTYWNQTFYPKNKKYKAWYKGTNAWKKKVVNHMMLDVSSSKTQCVTPPEFMDWGWNYTNSSNCISYVISSSTKLANLESAEAMVKDELGTTILGWCPTEIDENGYFTKGGLCTNTYIPAAAPTSSPTQRPTMKPTSAPVQPTFTPTSAPTEKPTTIAPTMNPTFAPTPAPTLPLFAAYHVRFWMGFTQAWDDSTQSFIESNRSQGDGDSYDDYDDYTTLAPTPSNGTNSSSFSSSNGSNSTASSLMAIQSTNDDSRRILTVDEVTSTMVQDLRCLMQEMVFNSTIAIEAMGITVPDGMTAIEEPRLAFLSDDFDGSQLVPTATIMDSTCFSIDPDSDASVLSGLQTLCVVDMPVVTDSYTRYTVPTVAPTPTAMPTGVPTFAPTLAPTLWSNQTNSTDIINGTNYTLAPTSFGTGSLNSTNATNAPTLLPSASPTSSLRRMLGRVLLDANTTDTNSTSAPTLFVNGTNQTFSPTSTEVPTTLTPTGSPTTMRPTATPTMQPTAPTLTPTSEPASYVVSLEDYLEFLFENYTHSPIYSAKRRSLQSGNGTIVAAIWLDSSYTTIEASIPYVYSGSAELPDRDTEANDDANETVCPVSITELLASDTPTESPTVAPVEVVAAAKEDTHVAIISTTSIGGLLLLCGIFYIVFGKRRRSRKDEEMIDKDDISRDRIMLGGKTFSKHTGSVHEYRPDECIRLFESQSSHGLESRSSKHVVMAEILRAHNDDSSEGTRASDMNGLAVDIKQLQLGPTIGMGSSGRIFKATYCGSDVAVKEFFPRSTRSAGAQNMMKGYSLGRQSTASGDNNSVGSRHRFGRHPLPPRYLSNSSTVRSNSTCSNVDVLSASADDGPVTRSPFPAEDASVSSSSRSMSMDATNTGVGGLGTSNGSVLNTSGLLTPGAAAHNVPEHETYSFNGVEDEMLNGIGESDEMLAEVKNLRRLRHPNVIRLFGCATAMSNDTGGHRFLVVMELAACSLQDLIFRLPKSLNLSFKNFDIARKLVVARQIAAGMAYIHDNHMIHFDVKCENVLLDVSGHAKICDLGIAKFTMGPDDKIDAVNHQGTPAYMAPELLRENTGITNKIDVYSYSLVLWQIMYEKQPHPRTWTVPKLFYEVRYNMYRPKCEENTGVDPMLIKLIQDCWDEDPENRPSFHDIIKALDRIIDSRSVKTDVIGAAKFHIGDSVKVWDYSEKRQLYAVVIDINQAEDTANIRLKANGEVRKNVPQVELTVIPEGANRNLDGSMHTVGGLAMSVGGLALIHAGAANGKMPYMATSEGSYEDGESLAPGEAPTGLGLDISALQPSQQGKVSLEDTTKKTSFKSENNCSNDPLQGLATESKTFTWLGEKAIDVQGIRFTEDGMSSEGKESDGKVKENLFRYAELGKGVSGTVSAALNLRNFDLCAIKEIRFASRDSRHQAAREFKALFSKLGRGLNQRCPYIVWLYDAYLDADSQTVCLVMELMDGGSLEDLVLRLKHSAMQALANAESRTLGTSKKNRAFNRLRSRPSSNDTVGTHGSGPSHRSSSYVASPSPTALKPGLMHSTGIVDEPTLALVARSVLRALAFLHEQSYVHLDIKPANILINSRSQVKLADFGLSKQLEKDSMANTFAGTMKYMSPERLRGEGHSHPSDVWSFGLTLMTLILGEFPMTLITDAVPVPLQSSSLPSSTNKARQASIASLTGGNSTGDANDQGQGSSIYWKLLERWNSGHSIELPSELLHHSPLLVQQQQRIVTPSPELRDFIKQTLILDPADRPDAETLLEHPWLRKHSGKLDSDLSSNDDDTLVLANAESSRATLQDIAFGIMAKASYNPRVLSKIGELECEDQGHVNISIPEEKLSHLADQLMLPVQVVQRSFNVASAAHQPQQARRPLISSSSSSSSTSFTKNPLNHH